MNRPGSSRIGLSLVLLLPVLAILSAAPAAANLDFYTVDPCRVFDSRGAGGPLMQGEFSIYTAPVAGVCGVPSDAVAVALNVTIVGATGDGNLLVFPAGADPIPVAASLPFSAGRNLAKLHLVPLGTGGAVGFRATMAPPSPGLYQMILDVSGYYLLNEPPVLTAGGVLGYAENDPPAVIDNTITVTDPDDTELASATVQITGNYQSGADVLSFVNIGPITGSFTAATGTLELTGTDTLANWQTALRSVRYENTSDDPSTAVRTVTWIASNGGSSTPVTSTINVTATNDAPVVDAAAFSVAEEASIGTLVGTATFTDPDSGQTHTFAITAGNTGGAFAIDSSTGDITVAAALDFETLNSYSLTVEVTDDGAPVLSGTATVTITVTDADDAPVAVDDAATVSEDDPATTINVLANDTDADGGPKLVQSVTQPANGTVVITNGGADLTYQPAADYCNGGSPADAFTYTLNGGSTATVSVTVTCVDDNPTAVDDSATVAEDSGASTIDVQANDTDGDGGSNTIGSVTQPANGAVVITNGGADLTYAPSADYCNDPPGTTLDTFTYTLMPGGSTATVTVTVTCVDDGPVAVDDAATVAEDSGASTINVQANDTDVDGGTNTITSVTQPANGAVVITNGGADLTYAPSANYCNNPPGTTLDTFTYTLTPGGSSATVTVTVTCIDDNPVAVGDAATVSEDSGANTINVLANDADIDGGPISITGATTPANGTVTITNGGLDLTYAPNADYCNNPPGTTPDTFTYTLNGGSSAAVTVSVTCANDGPVIDLDADDDKGTPGNDFAVTFTEGETATLIEDGIDATVTDVDSATLGSLTVTITNLLDVGEETLSADITGTSIVANYTAATGVLVLTGPDTIANFEKVLRTVRYHNSSVAPDPTQRVVHFVANDGADDGNTAVSTVTIVSVDTDPTAVDDGATVAEDSGANTIDVLANDTDPDGGTIEITSTTQPSNGTVAITNFGADLTYTPNANYCNGGSPVDSFTYTLNGGSAATVSVTVTCVDDNPTAVADSATVTEDSGANAIDVLANDTDPDGGPISITSTTQPANGLVTITGGGTGLTYTPDANYCNNPPGTTLDTFSYTLTPGGSSNTVTVTVTCVDDNPVAVNDAATVVEDSGANAIDVLANDTDVDGGSISITSVVQPSNGSVTITGGGTGLTYTPNANYCNNPPGTTLETFTYTLSPGGSAGTVTVTVTCVDDPPTAVADADTVDEDSGANTINVQANDTDIDGGTNTISAVTQPANGTVAITNGGADLSYTPDANYCNNPPATTPDTFTYTLSPGGSVASVSILVNCINDAPVLTNSTISYSTVGNTQLRAGEAATGTGVLHIRDNQDVAEKSVPSDIDGPAPPFIYSLGTAAANGTATVNSDGTFTYEPNPGFAGPTDSFTVNVSDGGVPAGVASVTVNVSISEMVWYVHDVVGADNPAASDDGRSSNAFEVLQDAINAAGPDDYVFVFRGNTGTTPHAPVTITNKDGLKLHGHGIGLTVPGFGALVPAGGEPNEAVIQNSAATAGEDNAFQVTINSGTIDNVEIRGFEIAATDNAIDVTVSGSATAGLRISENILGTTTLEGIDVNYGSTSAASTLAVHSNVLLAAGNAIDISRTSGTLKITSFNDNLVSGDTGGSGIVVSGAVFDANPGTGALDTVLGGNTAIGASGNPVGGSGMLLSSVSGALSFEDLDIYAGAAGLTIQGTGAFTGAAGTRIQVTPAFPGGSGTSVIRANNGAAVDIASATIDLQLDDMDSTTTGAAVALNAVGGTFTTDADASISKTSGGGTAFSVANSVSGTTVGYAGTMNVTSGAGVALTSNTGSTISFSGGMTLSTGANAGFSATGGGTVTVTDPAGLANNTIATTSGTALNVTGTTIGAAGLTFERISAGSGGTPVNGIVLNGTGSLGGLTVTGTGTTPGSGGTIQNTTNRGASFISAANVTLKNMNFTNNATTNGASCSSLTTGGNSGCNAPIHLDGVTTVLLDRLVISGSAQQGINGRNVTGFTLSNSTVAGIGNEPDENGLNFFNMLGTSAITGTTITGSFDDNLNIQNNTNPASGLTAITIAGSQFNTSTQGSGIILGARGSSPGATMAVDITSCTIDNNFSGGIPATAADSATLHLKISGCTITNNNDGIEISTSQGGNATFDIFSNTSISGNDFLAVNIFQANPSTGTLQGRIRDNSNVSIANGRTTDAFSINKTGNGTLIASISNNTISYGGTQRAILIQAGDGDGVLETTVTGNSIDIQLDGVGNAVAGMLAQASTTSNTPSMCVDIGGAASLRNSFTHSLGGSIPAGDIRVRQRNTGTVRLPGYAGAATDLAAVVAYLGGRNTVVSTPTASADSTGFGGGGACAQPVLP